MKQAFESVKSAKSNIRCMTTLIGEEESIVFKVPKEVDLEYIENEFV